MKKSIWIFLLAVLLPSVVLGWLALRSAEEQQIILEKRTAELYQKETENVSGAVRALIDGERRAFSDAVAKVIASENPREASVDFATKLSGVWPRKAVGFSLGKDGRLISPTSQKARNNAGLQKFLLENSAFLCSTMPATVYWVSGDDLSRPETLRRKAGSDYQWALKNGAEQVAQNSKALLKTETKADSATDSLAALKDAEKDTLSYSKKSLDGELSKNAKAPASPTPDPGASAAQRPATSMPAPTGSGGLRRSSGVFNRKPAAPLPAPAGAPSATPFPTPTAAPTAAPSAATPTAPTAAPSPSEAPAPTSTAATKAAASRADEKSRPAPAPAPDEPGLAPTKDASLNYKGASLPAKDRAHSLERAKEQLAAADPQQKGPSQLDSGGVTPLPTLNESQALVRNVAPQRMPDGKNNEVLSEIAPSTAEFKTLTSEGREGVITRFVQDQLDIIFWVRPAQDPEMVFGCLIESENLADLWPLALPSPDSGSFRNYLSRKDASPFSLALLDDKARPVATQPPGDTGREWKRPFVASEIGEALPHWEAALYLHRPEQLRESARALRRTLIFMVVAALGAIACGGWLVVADARRQLALAQQKTDFVSNVSHELKTPLTSIRMFAELMQNGRSETAAKHPQYLRIIMVEAERLTRLINNVLDFARIDRKQKRFERKPFDLHAVIERAWEGHELHLRESGFTTHWEAAPAPYPVIGDEDALEQILVNLLSNAEKYSSDLKEVELQTYLDGARVCVSVLDRGTGVPAGEERKIFEAFYRAHDSLSSGIQGSGLGLTLAQRLAREHGGEILYQAREGGGSNFTLRIPLAHPSPETSPSS